MTELNPYQAPDAELVSPSEELAVLTGPFARPAGAGARWIGEAFSLFGRSPWMWVLLGVIYMGMVLVGSFIPLVGSLAVSLFMYVVLGGLMIGCRDLEQGKELKVEYLFHCFSHKLNPLLIVGAIMLGASLAIGLIAGVGGAMSAGTLATMSGGASEAELVDGVSLMMMVVILVCLGLMLPLVMMVWFAPALIVFHGLSAWDAMKLSFRGCLKNIIPFLLYGLLFLVLSVVAAIPIFLGYLVLIPVSMITMYASYKAVYLEQ